jgi:hypothetical protein
MPEKFKSTWVPAPRSPTERWKQAVAYEIGMLPDEVDAFGNMLKCQFPGGIIYTSPVYASPARAIKLDPVEINRDLPPKGRCFSSLLEAGLATDRSYAFFRQPWPEELESGDEERMMNYRDSVGLGSHQDYRRMGRCFMISWHDRDIKLSSSRFRQRRDEGVVECEFRFITSAVTINLHYDDEDDEVVSFVHAVEDLLRQVTTCDFASYDPCTHEVINMARRDASQPRSIGVVRYASLNDRIYFGWCHRNGRPPEVMGPRPEVRAAFRREAGLED